ncbi:unnamed protein product [Mucor circinelloides]
MDISKLLVQNTEIITSKTTINSIKRKKTSVNQKKRHACTWLGCRKSFSRPSDMTRHYRIHTNDRPYQCPLSFCGKRFIQRSALTVHQRTHSGEKPHICQFPSCNKSFGDSSSLARHRRIHTQIRSYICTELNCTKSYTKKSHLTRHTRRSHIQNIKEEKPECIVAAILNSATATTSVTTDDDDDEEEEEIDEHDDSYNPASIVKTEDTLTNQISSSSVVYPSTINQQPNYWPATNPLCYSSNNNNIIYSYLPTVYQPTGSGYYYHGQQGYNPF